MNLTNTSAKALPSLISVPCDYYYLGNKRIVFAECPYCGIVNSFQATSWLYGEVDKVECRNMGYLKRLHDKMVFGL